MPLSPERIRKALGDLGLDDDGDWTSDGLPSMESLKTITKDASLSRAQVTAAAPTFTRSNPSFEAPKPAVPDVIEPAATVAAELAPSGEGDAAALAALRAEFAAAQGDTDRAQAALDVATKAYEKARRRSEHLADKVSRAEPRNSFERANAGYLAGAREERRKRAAGLRAMQEAGLSPEKIKAMLPHASAVDASAQRRKAHERSQIPLHPDLAARHQKPS